MTMAAELKGKASFRTERLYIRPVSIDDKINIEKNIKDLRVARSTGTIPYPLPEGYTEQFIKNSLAKDQSEDAWGIELKRADRIDFVGVVSLNRLDRSQSEIAYWVVPSIWNTGIATEAVKAFIKLNPQGCRTIFGSVFQDNPASSRVLENSGFEYIGLQRIFLCQENNRFPHGHILGN
ncbi:MAG: GNAT family N-acetyltransferase [Paracoccaceae bacterium]